MIEPTRYVARLSTLHQRSFVRKVTPLAPTGGTHTSPSLSLSFSFTTVFVFMNRFSCFYRALGVLIYEMLAGFPPFFDEGTQIIANCFKFFYFFFVFSSYYYSKDPFGIYEKILSDAPIAFPSHFHKDARVCFHFHFNSFYHSYIYLFSLS